MSVTERASGRRAWRAGALASLVVGVIVAMAEAQNLPRVDGALTMSQAVDLALDKSLRVKAASADASTMESMRKEALAPFWPQMSANGYFVNQRLAPNVYTSAGTTMARNYQVFGADQNRDGNFTAMYSLFAGGRDYYTYRAAAHRADAGREMLRGAEVDVAMQARLDYIATVRETENLGVLGDLLRDIDERLRVTREQFDAGRVPRYYVLRDEAERANVVQMQAMTQSRAELALVALKTTLGIDLASAVTLAERLDYIPLILSIEEGIREASERQPELKVAVKQREAAEAEVRAAYGNYFPQVSLSYMYDWLWSKNRNEPKSSDDGYSVGLVVTLPLFDGFLRENALKTTRSKLERAVQAEGLVRQQIAKDVNQAALMLAAADKGVAASRAGLVQAEEDFRVVRERFEAGRGIQVEVLDAQVALTRARFNTVNALAEYHTALAMWLRATGRTR
jgi:outer membrane protein TolC